MQWVVKNVEGVVMSVEMLHPLLLAWTEHSHEQADLPEIWTQHFEDPKLEYTYSSGLPQGQAAFQLDPA
jgi:hypothetical protein